MISREKKSKLIEQLAVVLKESASVIFADFSGLATSELNKLKKELRAHSVRFKVTKKSLWPLVFKKAGLVEEPIVREHPGSVAIAYGPVEGIETAKTLKAFAKSHEALKIVGGFLWGEFHNPATILKVAELPNREVLLGMTAGVIAAPLRSFVGVLRSPLRDLVGVIKSISNK